MQYNSSTLHQDQNLGAKIYHICQKFFKLYSMTGHNNVAITLSCMVIPLQHININSLFLWCMSEACVSMIGLHSSGIATVIYYLQ